MGNEINILELFSGIGGFTKGFQDAGYTMCGNAVTVAIVKLIAERIKLSK